MADNENRFPIYMEFPSQANMNPGELYIALEDLRDDASMAVLHRLDGVNVVYYLVIDHTIRMPIRDIHQIMNQSWQQIESTIKNWCEALQAVLDDQEGKLNNFAGWEKNTLECFGIYLSVEYNPDGTIEILEDEFVLGFNIYSSSQNETPEIDFRGTTEEITAALFKFFREYAGIE